MDYISKILELEMNIQFFEKEITQEISNIMTEKNYIRFYKRQNDWIFQDNEGNIYQSDTHIQSSLDHYYQIIDKPHLDIYL